MVIQTLISASTVFPYFSDFQSSNSASPSTITPIITTLPSTMFNSPLATKIIPIYKLKAPKPPVAAPKPKKEIIMVPKQIVDLTEEDQTQPMDIGVPVREEPEVNAQVTSALPMFDLSLVLNIQTSSLPHTHNSSPHTHNS